MHIAGETAPSDFRLSNWFPWRDDLIRRPIRRVTVVDRAVRARRGGAHVVMERLERLTVEAQQRLDLGAKRGIDVMCA
jgi:hypothetical protein